MRILVFGDIPGAPRLLHHLPREAIAGVVGAAIRPQYIEALRHHAESLGVPFLLQPKWQSAEYEEFKHQVADLHPDLIWVNSYSMIIRDDVLALTRLGGLNIHAALLPRNRGCNPIQWAILNGDHETGVTLHKMTSGLDEGPVLDQKKLPIYFEDTWKTLSDRIATATDELIAANLPAILYGELHAIPQQQELATVGRRRKPEDGQFNWEQPIVQIYNLMRALLPPLPPAYYINSDGKKEFLDRYYTPMEIAYLKYGTAGGRQISSNRVSLRPLKQSENSMLCDWIANKNEPLVLNSLYPPVTEGNHELRSESITSMRTDLVLFVVEGLLEKQSIGTCQLLNINWRHRRAELQINLGLAGHHDDGLDTEVADLLTQFGFADLDLHRIYLHVVSTNVHTIKAYEKCDFSREGLLRDAAFIDGSWVDVVVMGKLADDK